MPDDRVEDDERLYRSIKNAPENFHTADGELRLSSQAFADRWMRPSVDRAHLREFDPMRTQFDPADGVVSKVALDIRQIRGQRYDAKGNAVQEYAVDVEPVPLEDNPAHAEIFGRPGFDNKSVFRRICEALAREVTWEIFPVDYQ